MYIHMYMYVPDTLEGLQSSLAAPPGAPLLLIL